MGTMLLTGASLVLSYRFDAEAALELIERHGVTFTTGAITAFIAMMNAESERDTSTLRTIVSGGAPIPPSTVEAFEKRFGVYIHNIYGLTETTSPSHCVPIGTRAPVDPASGALSVGVPVYGTVVRVVDEQGDELPAGEVGELVTSGPQVVPGYWGKPDASRRAIPAGRLHTGDIGFMDPDGWFYVVDRKKGPDQRRRLQGLAARGRGRPLRAPGRPRGRGRRRAGRLPRRDGQGVRQPTARRERRRRRPDRLLPRAHGRLQVPAAGRVRRRAAQDGER
jgi:acyl-CoA synthetase (AMP-forming)/AMP-acid ligase II